MKNYKDILKRYWGYDDFRGIQLDIIKSVGEGHDTLGLMPTGGGKSITFQVPAMAMEGVCIVITPLIALMKDQVQNLRRRGIRAAAIYTGLSHDTILQTLENAVFGAVKLLYISPERLASDLFQKKLSHMNVSFICVDEAHCISQWGYDFRPSYLTIADIRRLVPHAPVLALTATATEAVVKDIQDKLRKPDSDTPSPSFNVFRMSFERKNLAYIVEQTNDKGEQLVRLLHDIEGSAIVYTRSRQHTKEYTELLQNAGFSAVYYHAGLDNAEKDRRQNDWQADKVRVIVATNAFGMGIDKADVRLVAHVDCPDSIEAYFQEAGRAGRDGNKAYAVLLYNENDRQKLLKRIDDTFPPKDYVRQVYEHLSYFYQVGVGSGYNATFEFSIDKFCHAFKHFPIRVKSALKILNRAGYIEYMEEEDSQARVMFILERDDLYRLKGHKPDEEAVIVALLRNYSGLFNEYQFIDEAFLAQQTNLRQPQVYAALLSLSQKKIVSFIPQKRIPFVRYMQRREDAQHIIIAPDVYDDLKNRYSKRISSMIEYATTQNICRSRMLLRYFGENRTKDCGQCDVCIDSSDEQKSMASDLILQLLGDGRQHHISELHAIGQPFEALEHALLDLVDECVITNDDGFLKLNP